MNVNKDFKVIEILKIKLGCLILYNLECFEHISYRSYEYSYCILNSSYCLIL